jgi:hypothetical protein
MNAPFQNSAPVNDTARVREYNARLQALYNLRRSADPRDRKVWADLRDSAVASGLRTLSQREVDALLRERGLLSGERAVTPSSVHGPTFMSNLSVQFANERFIGEELMPTVAVDKLSDEYAIYSRRDILAFPDDSMKGQSEANEIFDNRTPGTYSCEPRSLKKRLEKKVVDNQDAVFDEMFDLSMQVSMGMAHNRERRAMNILTNAANFGGNTTALVAGQEWDSVNGGDPVLTIRTAVHSLWSGNGPTRIVAYCPLNVYLALSTHPSILDLTKYTSGGFVPRAVLAALFEVDDLLIAKAWEDIANEGQSADIRRMVSSDVFGIVRVASGPSLRNASFGYNMRFKGEVNNITWYDPQRGTRGSYYNQQSCDEVHKVIAPETGWLITNCLA